MHECCGPHRNPVGYPLGIHFMSRILRLVLCSIGCLRFFKEKILFSVLPFVDFSVFLACSNRPERPWQPPDTYSRPPRRPNSAEPSDLAFPGAAAVACGCRGTAPSQWLTGSGATNLICWFAQSPAPSAGCPVPQKNWSQVHFWTV